VPWHADLSPDLGDDPLSVDEEGRSLDSHVGPYMIGPVSAPLAAKSAGGHHPPNSRILRRYRCY
jgi:hypothetical protein